MAVYTTPGPAALAAFLADYALGPCLALTPIRDGIENSNFFLDTAGARHVLTLFESASVAELPWFLDLMDFLGQRGLPCTHPRPRRDRGFLGQLCGKPAALFARMHGRALNRPSAAECAALGEVLARLHLAASRFSPPRADGRGPAWRAATAAAVLPRVEPSVVTLLRSVTAVTADFPPAGLPTGIIHADLFRDNVLFGDGRPTGLLDFYFACEGPLVYDLAIAVIDWCFMPTGTLDAPAAQALLTAYARRRPLAANEGAAWLTALRTAGLRFWLSRLAAACAPRDGALAWQKDPREFEHFLHVALDDAVALRELWPCGGP